MREGEREIPFQLARFAFWQLSLFIYFQLISGFLFALRSHCCCHHYCHTYNTFAPGHPTVSADASPYAASGQRGKWGRRRRLCYASSGETKAFRGFISEANTVGHSSIFALINRDEHTLAHADTDTDTDSPTHTQSQTRRQRAVRTLSQVSHVAN